MAHRLHRVSDRLQNPFLHGPDDAFRQRTKPRKHHVGVLDDGPGLLGAGLPTLGMIMVLTPTLRQGPGPTPSLVQGDAGHLVDRVPHRRRLSGRLRPFPVQHPEHEQSGHQQSHVQRTPPGRRAHHAQGGTGQNC
ncbi:hypothetical protein SAM40697_4150 [Streptomyces ambofaciens]|uniref:Uncharacterized protein n=1 Tax=Streptomyces ambofaciens TaxID=1889 RepID=A0ABM6B338_STRAM|nr:hypothetical protein SAM40697_4150 [Streptomyces ambofaciens]